MSIIYTDVQVFLAGNVTLFEVLHFYLIPVLVDPFPCFVAIRVRVGVVIGHDISSTAVSGDRCTLPQTSSMMTEVICWLSVPRNIGGTTMALISLVSHLNSTIGTDYCPSHGESLPTELRSKPTLTHDKHARIDMGQGRNVQYHCLGRLSRESNSVLTDGRFHSKIF